MTFRRRTIKELVKLEGLGLHTGVPVKVTIQPGNEGIRFRYGGSAWQAKPDQVTDTTRSTRLGEVGTVEHLMSALAGLEVTDVDVELDAPECPGLDGSAQIYVKELVAAGFEELDEVSLPDLFSRVFLQEEHVKIAIAKGEGHWRYDYDMGFRWPNLQSYETTDIVGAYVPEIAPARTFALAEEVPHLIQNGLGRGLDENSALILGIENYKNEPRFIDEPARHKLLDLAGDLYLSGVPLKFLNVVAERSGHKTNVTVASMLATALEISV